MTKSVLIEKVGEKVKDLTATRTEMVVDTIFESMKQALLKGDKVEIRGFGHFRLKTRESRQARNPKTWEKVQVPAKKVLFFKVGKELRAMLNDSKGNNPIDSVLTILDIFVIVLTWMEYRQLKGVYTS